jgi:hypothetical protein
MMMEGIEPMEHTIWRKLMVNDDRNNYFIGRQILAAAHHGKFLLEWVSTVYTPLHNRAGGEVLLCCLSKRGPPFIDGVQLKTLC